jgi:ABC-type polysaccharide/polyol phosphate transport system ATPase subunit
VIAAKLDEIAEFTELGDFLALPKRTYSAGMFERLAFAVSIAAHNDILLIDEGIGAGDAAFQKKAQQRIEGLFDRTPIVILASHSEMMISEFCNRRVEGAWCAQEQVVMLPYLSFQLNNAIGGTRYAR